MGEVVAVCKSPEHSFSKPVCEVITLVAGMGVEGDAHYGKTVKHRSRVAQDPTQPNLRQVHLIHDELHQELIGNGFDVAPGIMGENITTRGINLLGLPRHTRLHIGSSVVLEVTGLRNPCRQLNEYQDGLMQAVLDKTDEGDLILRSGIMAIIVSGGEMKSGDKIEVRLPDLPHEKLERV